MNKKQQNKHYKSSALNFLRPFFKIKKKNLVTALRFPDVF